MTKDVNIFISDWVKTGTKINVPQYAANLTINWIDNQGVRQTRTELLKFPDCLLLIEDKRLQETMQDIMVEEARSRLVN